VRDINQVFSLISYKINFNNNTVNIHWELAQL